MLFSVLSILRIASGEASFELDLAEKVHEALRQQR